MGCRACGDWGRGGGHSAVERRYGFSDEICHHDGWHTCGTIATFTTQLTLGSIPHEPTIAHRGRGHTGKKTDGEHCSRKFGVGALSAAPPHMQHKQVRIATKNEENEVEMYPPRVHRPQMCAYDRGSFPFLSV